MTVVAVNIEPSYPLGYWVDFWKSTGAGNVLWAQDTYSNAAREFQLVALGTEILVDRQGRIAFRRDGPVGYKKLQSEIEKVL